MLAFSKTVDSPGKGVGLFFFFVVVIILILGWVVIVNPLIGKTFCTLLGALGTGIEVRFSNGEMPESYEIIVDSPKEGVQKIKCPNGGSNGTYSSKCTSTGAFIATGFSSRPEDYTVTVHTSDKTFTQKIDPGSCQDASATNGKDCPPFCYSARSTVNLTP